MKRGDVYMNEWKRVTDGWDEKADAAVHHGQTGLVRALRTESVWWEHDNAECCRDSRT